MEIDLTAKVEKREPQVIDNPFYKEKTDFSVLLRVSADPISKESYEIISATTDDQEKRHTDWKIGVQANGAWYAEIGTYKYYPTDKQTIRDGQWHTLALSFDYKKKVVCFYYNGKKGAIYNVEDLSNMHQAKKIEIGGRQNPPQGYWNQWEAFYGKIADVKLSHQLLEDDDHSSDLSKEMSSRLQVMTFNIWNGGNETGKEVGVQRVIETIKESGADIITMQETYGSGEKIADGLDYYFYLISSNLSIMSRYPIIETYQIFRSFNSGGAKIDLGEHGQVNVFSVWLHYLPNYMGAISEGTFSEHEFIKGEKKHRVDELQKIYSDILSVTSNDSSTPIVIGGDFNSGSHLDWIEETKHHHKGYILSWPQSLYLEEKGFKDGYREVHPNVTDKPGFSFPAIESESIKDRIDYVYYKGSNLEAIEAKVYDTHPIAYSSDHGAVNVTFRIKNNY